MKIIGLDGKEYKLTLGKRKQRENCSSLHQTARKLLKELFPFYYFHEEVYLPGSKNDKHDTLIADFINFPLHLLVEPCGRQHYEFIPHFHVTRRRFILGKIADNDKKFWCEVNSLDYVELPFNESLEEWKQRILKRESPTN